MKKIIFTLIMAFTAVMTWAQDYSGLTVSYKDGNETKEQTFNLDSVLSYGYNPVDQTIFVQPDIGATLGIPFKNLISFAFPPIVPDSAGVSDYLVVNANGQKAAFLLADGFEMTWKGGVLAIKDKNQSQSIGLKNGISFTVEKLSFGYTNPRISSTPGTGSWYLVTKTISSGSTYSHDSNYYCNHLISNNERWLYIGQDGKLGHSVNISAIGKLYMSDTVIDIFWEY